MEAAIMGAFVDDSDEAWGALLEATGAAHYDDGRADAPAIDVQHSETGAAGACALHWWLPVGTKPCVAERQSAKRYVMT